MIKRLKYWHWRWNCRQLNRYMPKNADELPGRMRLRAVNNAIILKDKLPKDKLKPIPGAIYK